MYQPPPLTKRVAVFVPIRILDIFYFSAERFWLSIRQ